MITSFQTINTVQAFGITLGLTKQNKRSITRGVYEMGRLNMFTLSDRLHQSEIN
jgi:hypothetical protein